MKKPNPHCPVSGCKTTKLHTDDPMVAGLIREFSDPLKMTGAALAAMAELRDSLRRDYEQDLKFSWFSRLRQPEELYTRTLYALFISTEKELGHIFSDDTPNGLAPMYRKVNELVFEGKGLLLTNNPGLEFGEFKPIDMLHSGGHVSFKAIFTCISIAQYPELWRQKALKHLLHVNMYCQRLDHMRRMFQAGRDKSIVLDALKQMHRTIEPVPAASSS